MYLYHYYDKRSGPFRSLTAMQEAEAVQMLERLRGERPGSMCAKRDEGYLSKRRRCEAILKREFLAKGGIVRLDSPYYMVVEHSPWLGSWYEQGAFLKIPIEEFDVRTVSFTYGDSMPTFSDRVNDGKEYRKKLYTYDEILCIIEKYGLPQDWNDDGSHGPERYIEAHVWSGETIAKYATAEHLR
ncbi:MAG: hypothetical protein ILP18_11090 [Treponema sp.]|nr:hypothetical protein [Treponema sp.]